MNRISISHKLAFGLSLAILALGCDVDFPDPDRPEDVEPLNTCGALPLSGDTSGDTSAVPNFTQSSCRGEAGGGDVIYQVSLEEESSLTIAVTPEDYNIHNPGISVRRACDDVQSEVFCGGENLFIPVLPAGEYFVIVEGYLDDGFPDGGYSEDGPFDLSIEIAAPSCLDDILEGTSNDGIEYVGGENLAPGDFEPRGNASAVLTICNRDGPDTDKFLFPHMGGELNFSVSGLDGAPAPRARLTEANYGRDENGVFGVYLEGDTKEPGDLPQGDYFLIVDAPEGPATGTPYEFSITHACVGGPEDGGNVEGDESVFGPAEYVNGPVLRDAIMCPGDRDVVVAETIFGGDIILVVNGGAGFAATAVSIDESADQETPIPQDSFSAQVVGEDLVVTLPTAPGERVGIRLGSGTRTEAVNYDASIRFAAYDEAPANDTCEGAERLTSGVKVIGRTTNATHDIAGPPISRFEDGEPTFRSCNGDDVDPSVRERTADVFYTFTLANDVDVRLDLEGRGSWFSNAIYLLEFEDSVCPSDLSTLNPILLNNGFNTEGFCLQSTYHSIDLPQLPAGDYLFVVDGQYTALNDSLSEGTFELTFSTFPDGLPEN